MLWKKGLSWHDVTCMCEVWALHIFMYIYVDASEDDPFFHWIVSTDFDDETTNESPSQNAINYLSHILSPHHSLNISSISNSSSKVSYHFYHQLCITRHQNATGVGKILWFGNTNTLKA